MNLYWISTQGLFRILMIVFVLNSCGKESLIPDNKEPIPEPDPMDQEQVDLRIDENSFLALKQNSGIQDAEVIISDGDSWRFRLDIPEKTEQQNQKYPMVIALVGAASGVDRHIVFHDCIIEPGLENIDAYVFLPEPGPWTNKIEADKILHFIELAIKHWDVHPDQVVITGYSKGGEATWNYAIKFPDVFAAAIPIAGTHILADKPVIPIFGIIGENDSVFSPTKMQMQVEESSFDKSMIRIVGGLYHHEVCEFIYSLRDATVWLKECVFVE